MPRLIHTDRHTIYPVEIWGDTLVVIPRGDAAGFNPTAVNSELATITELAQTPPVKHLVIDFGEANYFGSIVLGALVQLAQAVRQRGGRIALCGLSEDMQQVIRLMKLESLWESFPNRSLALRAIAAIPLRQKLYAARWVFAWFAAAALIVTAYIVWPRPDYGRIYYAEINGLWKEYQDLKDRAGEEEWSRFVKQSNKRLDPIIKHLNQRALAGKWKAGENFLLYAARDHWPNLMNRRSDHLEREAKMVQYYLAFADATFTQGGIPANFQAEFTKTVLSKESTAPSTEPANTPSAVPTKPVP